MKAVLALVVIYVGTFLIFMQGASQNSVQAAPQHTAAGAPQAASSAIDPGKEADIRSLMELLGVHDLIQDSENKGIETIRENLMASVPESGRGQEFVAAFVASYQKKFSADDITNQLVGIYDKHFTDDEIKGLLQFYGSPLGQKYAAEMPAIGSEAQTVSRSVSTRVAKEVLQDLRKQYPGIGAQARLNKARPAVNEPAKQQAQAQPEAQASASQP